MQLHGLAELLGGHVGVAVRERPLADRVGQRGERVGCPVSDEMRVSASAQACAPPRSSRRAKNTAAQRRPFTA